MFKKVENQRFICQLKLHFEGDFKLINLSGDAPEQSRRFYHTIHDEKYNPSDLYFSKGSFNFSENGQETESGFLYKSQAVFRFPSNDSKRAQRIEEFTKAKFLEMILNDGTSFIMGRNDVFQNRKPSVSFASTFHLTEVKISSESIQPVLQVFKESDGGVPLIGYDYVYNFELS